MDGAGLINGAVGAIIGGVVTMAGSYLTVGQKFLRSIDKVRDLENWRRSHGESKEPHLVCAVHNSELAQIAKLLDEVRQDVKQLLSKTK